MKNNQLIVDDTGYVIDSTYIAGADAFRNRVPNSCNPYGDNTDKSYAWDYGHTNDSCDLHIVDGVDVITVTRNGTVYRIAT